MTVKWPRKNDADSIRARQEALGLDGEVTAIDLERAPVCTGEQLRLSRVAVAPPRPDRVDHPARGEPPRGRRLGVPGRAAAEPARLGEDLRPTRAVDGSVDPTAAAHPLVGRVDDRVDVQLGDVRAYN